MGQRPEWYLVALDSPIAAYVFDSVASSRGNTMRLYRNRGESILPSPYINPSNSGVHIPYRHILTPSNHP